MRPLVLVICILLSLPTSANSLLEVFKLAEKQDPELAAAKAKYSASREAKPQARALLLPNINLSARTSRNNQLNSGLNTDFDNDYISLQLTQPVFNFTSIYKLKQAKITTNKASIDLSSTYQTLIIRVAERYFAVLSAKDLLAFSKSDKRAISRRLEQAKKRFEVGLIAITNVHEARSARDLAVSQVIAAENAFANTKEQLREITGFRYDMLASLRKNIPLTNPEPLEMSKWTETALTQNLSIKSVEYDVKVASMEIKVQKSKHLPTLDFVASKSNSQSTGGFFGSRDIDTESVELRLTVPIFKGGRTYSLSKQAGFKYTEATELLEKQRRLTVSQTRNAYRGVTAGISQVKALKQAIVSSQSALKATQAGYEVGTRTIVDVLNSQQKLFKAKSNYSKARHEYILNLLRLKQAAGTLSVKDLKIVDAWLKGVNQK